MHAVARDDPRSQIKNVFVCVENVRPVGYSNYTNPNLFSVVAQKSLHARKFFFAPFFTSHKVLVIRNVMSNGVFCCGEILLAIDGSTESKIILVGGGRDDAKKSLLPDQPF